MKSNNKAIAKVCSIVSIVLMIATLGLLLTGGSTEVEFFLITIVCLLDGIKGLIV